MQYLARGNANHYGTHDSVTRKDSIGYSIMAAAFVLFRGHSVRPLLSYTVRTNKFSTPQVWALMDDTLSYPKHLKQHILLHEVNRTNDHGGGDVFG